MGSPLFDVADRHVEIFAGRALRPDRFRRPRKAAWSPKGEAQQSSPLAGLTEPRPVASALTPKPR